MWHIKCEVRLLAYDNLLRRVFLYFVWLIELDVPTKEKNLFVIFVQKDPEQQKN